MTQLNFDSFDDYDNKLNCYLINNNIVDKFKKCKLDGIKKMVDELNLIDRSDSQDVN